MGNSIIQLNNIVIQLKNDTAANWASGNPVLALGEMGLETDTNKIKFGDGATAWSSLPYFSGGGGGGSSSFKYGEYGLSADQSSNLGANKHIEFDTLLNGSLNPPSTGTGQEKGTITLPAGKTYKIQLITQSVHNPTGELRFRMYNETASDYFGMVCMSMSVGYNDIGSFNGQLVSFITTTVDTDINARIIISTRPVKIDDATTRLIIEEYAGY